MSTRKGIQDPEAAARIRAILREYLGQDLPDEVLIWEHEKKVAPGGISHMRADYMLIELKADKDK